MFGWFKDDKKKHGKVSNDSLDFNKLPVMTAEELIQFTEQQNRIRLIKRIVKIDGGHFEVMYLDVIYRFAELVQLMPASQAHHHAVPGGLFIHTLEVIQEAMNLRQQYKLPAFAEQEVQERERHAWTYAVFAAAILHDIGKRVTLCAFVRDDGEIHSAFDDQYLSATGCQHYKLVFQDPKYHAMHEVIGLAMMDILPPIGRAFLFQHLNIIKEMMAYIHGDNHNAGAIGEIISKADQKSTGKSLSHTPTRKFKGASLENFGERLMTTLRQLIASNAFVINKNNANIYIGKNGYTYCVSKVVVDAIRKDMLENQEFDVPSDNNRLFDTFQEYGFIEKNERTGKSIHTICLHDDGATRVFTVLKFKTNRLFRITPEAYEGIIEEVESREAVAQRANQSPATDNNPIPTCEENPFAQPTATASATPQTVPVNQTQQPATGSPSQPTGAVNQTLPAGVDSGMLNGLLAETMQPSATGDATQLAETANDLSPTETGSHVQQADKDNVIAKSSPTPNPPPDTGNNSKSAAKTAEMQLAENFLIWCRKRVIDKDIVINESSGLMQKVKYKGQSVISVVSPRIFYEYTTVMGLPNPKDRKVYSKVQNAVHNNKLNIPAARGQLHKLKIKKSINNPLGGHGRFSAYLFDIATFAGDDTAFKEIIDKLPDNTNLVVG